MLGKILIERWPGGIPTDDYLELLEVAYGYILKGGVWLDENGRQAAPRNGVQEILASGQFPGVKATPTFSIQREVSDILPGAKSYEDLERAGITMDSVSRPAARKATKPKTLDQVAEKIKNDQVVIPQGLTERMRNGERFMSVERDGKIHLVPDDRVDELMDTPPDEEEPEVPEGQMVLNEQEQGSAISMEKLIRSAREMAEDRWNARRGQ